ncbi:alpha/beta-hydrolase [Gloeophyllum trabeum ATCC 11539]|uniref:Alpha/beta-hydrolase n=1 Tax=Gloeophyllum trabeum (strain ATCC 11539 / FP-39264 / Madison 617) TaxID=670483 RepID=S7PW36_GLOTA|nr:alpha/beta-hydrolase [Gloeophyllum trabeum ATCC 11539]EPQ51733.1 alpha/beta-hydrolase [Gloeophyllum trabeum ATCC 11539]
MQLPSGQEIHVEVHPPSPASPDDVPVVFIHGLLESSRFYHPVLAHLPHRTRILYDYDAHGRTPASAAPTLASLAAEIPQILAQLGYAPGTAVDVVAHSGGCLIAMHLASSHRVTIRRLVLMGHAPLPIPRAALLANAQLLRTREGLAGVVERWKSFLGQRARADPRILAALDAEKAAHDPEGVTRVCAALAKFEFRAFAGDVVVVMGREDPFRNVTVWEELRKRGEGEGRVRLCEMECGHYFALEDPEGTAGVIREALEGGL